METTLKEPAAAWRQSAGGNGAVSDDQQAVRMTLTEVVQKRAEIEAKFRAALRETILSQFAAHELASSPESVGGRLIAWLKRCSSKIHG